MCVSIKKSTEQSQLSWLETIDNNWTFSAQCCWRMSARSWTRSWSLCFWGRPLNRAVPCVSVWETPPLNTLPTFASTLPPSSATRITCLRPPSRYCSGKQPQALFYFLVSQYAFTRFIVETHFIINMENTVTLILIFRHTNRHNTICICVLAI